MNRVNSSTFRSAYMDSTIMDKLIKCIATTLFFRQNFDSTTCCWLPSVIVLSLFMACGGCDSTDESVEVMARDYSLKNLPVAVELSSEKWGEEDRICMESNGVVTPGQIELTENGEKLIWFLADVEAGASRGYRVMANGNCGSPQSRWEHHDHGRSDLLIDDIRVLQYVHVYPIYDDSGEVAETQKPFHHVYAPVGDRLITKGVGGLYPHHRGIFFGYDEVRVNGETYNIWVNRNGERSEHHEFDEEWTGPVFGGHEVTIYWKDNEGKPFIEEHRRIRAFRLSEEEILIDFESTLRSLRGRIELDGDLQHAGVQFRAAQYVADHPESSRYFRPEPWTDYPPDEELLDTEEYVDLHWNAFQFVIEDAAYTVAYISHPDNPSGGQMSERLYGRFGEFIPYEIDEDSPLTLRYRFLIAEGHETGRNRLNALYEGYYRVP